MDKREFISCPHCGKKLCKAFNPDMEIICTKCGSTVDVKTAEDGIKFRVKMTKIKKEKIDYKTAN